MKNKVFSLMFAGLVALVLVASLVSAVVTVSSPQLSRTGNSVNITIQSTLNETISFSGLNSIVSNGKQITFSVPSAVVVNASQPKTVTVNYNIESGFEFELGQKYATTLISDGSSSPQVSTELVFQPNSNFCRFGEVGDLSIDIEVNNVKGFGEEDDEWYLFDEIEVEVDVENNGDDDLDDVIVEWALINADTGEIVLDDEEDEFDVKDDDEETITFTFSVDPDDFEDTDEDYILHIKAYSDDTGEDSDCADASESVKVIFDDDFVVLNELQMTGSSVQCGETAQFSADVWNIGEDDQDEVKVIVLNRELSINKEFEIGDIDSLEDESFNGEIAIPKTASERTYSFEFLVYDEDSDIFENDNDDESRFFLQVPVTCGGTSGNGGTGSGSGNVVISAALVSGGKSGEEMVVRATITNAGSSLASYTVNAVGQSGWTSGSRITPQSLVLDGGDSGDVTITLDVNEGVSGEQQFTIEAVSGGKLVASQPVTVSIEGTGLFSGEGLINSDNWYLWVVGLLNVILVIVIIIVAVRVARS